MSERKYYLDNIKWITVLLVILYHVFYIFNCSGVVSNINVQGIPEFDAIQVFLYPWIMCLMFAVSGISSRYSLKKRTNKEFIKDRAVRILVPSIAGTFAYGWIAGYYTNIYGNIFGENANMIPGFAKYITFSLIGMGPLWYCHVLFLASVLLVIIRKIDKKDKLSELLRNIHPLVLIPIALLVWESSKVLNVPVVTVYRLGIYLLMFFLGYYILSNEELLGKMEKIAKPLMGVALLAGIVYTIFFYGQNYSSDTVLQHWATNFYLWIATIAILVFGKKYLNFSNKFSIYMTKNNFNYYVLHYTVELILSYVIVTYLNLPFILNYVLIIIGTVVILPILIEIVKRIPVVKKLILGVK